MPELSASRLDRYSRDLVTNLLERLPVPFLLLERDGTVAHANELCEAVLADGRHLRRDSEGQLAFDSTAAREQARSFLLQPRDGVTDIDLVLTSERGEPPLVAVIGWLSLPMLDDFPAIAPLAVLLIRSHIEVGAIDVAQSIDGLSRTERQVVRAIVDGQTLAEHAAERGVSIHTVRKQLANAMRKTRTTRQGELVRLATRLK